MTTEQLIDRIAAVAEKGDWGGVQRLLVELSSLMTNSGRPLGGQAGFKLVEILSKAPQTGAPSGASPYAIIAEVKKLATQKASRDRARDFDASKLMASWETLYALLATSPESVERESVREVLTAFKSARIFDLLARTADRSLAWDPDDAVVKNLYGQALIENGQKHAAIDILLSVLRMPTLSKADRAETHGLMGRARKQLYIDHVKSSSVAPSIKLKFRPFLEGAIEAYAAAYDSNRPADNFWHGTNLVALLMLAREDGQRGVRNPTALEPEVIAQRIIDALEPMSSKTSEPWVLAALGENYLALGNYEKASTHYGNYVNHPATDSFRLGSTVRQLEEVWRLHPGQDKGGAILAVLKAAQIAKPEGKFTLAGDEIQQLRKFASSGDYQHQAEFMVPESMVPGGSYVKLAELQRVVARAAGVAGICDQTGRTMGTGFLVRGQDLCKELEDGLYLLTNAHVMSDPKKEGFHPGSLDPQHSIAKLEAAEGSVLKFDPTVVWQSPIAEYDATLVKVTDASKGLMPLPIESSNNLSCELPEKLPSGTRVSVIGHPLGGPLSLSVLGSLSGANGVLVDMGARKGADKDPSYLHYRAPTEPGNSGSPVFETDNWNVIGLHHMGFDQFSGRPRLGGKAGSHFANEGICIRSIQKAIAEHIKANKGSRWRRK